jgi:hypothetical protein
MPGAELQQQAFLYTHTIMILFEIHRSNTIHNFLTAAGSMAFPCLRRRNCTLQYFRGHPNRAFSPNYVEIELVLFEFLVDCYRIRLNVGASGAQLKLQFFLKKNFFWKKSVPARRFSSRQRGTEWNDGWMH